MPSILTAAILRWLWPPPYALRLIKNRLKSKKTVEGGIKCKKTYVMNSLTQGRKPRQRTQCLRIYRECSVI